jgi:diphthamide synthase subunit DPH2
MWFMFYRDTMNSQRLINFMQRLVRDAGRKVFLILDNLHVHQSEAVKTWLEKSREQIEVFYLPPDSPELNPGDYLNGDLKGRVHSGQPVRDGHDLVKKARGQMHRLQQQPTKGQSFFRHPHVRYAGN